jgi:hypothetical protein
MLITGGKITSTAKTPEILLSPEGVIRIKGRWMMQNNARFSRALSDWYDTYIFEQGDISAIDIHIEYFSGTNFHLLISLLRRFLYSRFTGYEIPINWYYDEGDEDILDLGEYFSTALGKTFNFIMIPNKKISSVSLKMDLNEKYLEVRQYPDKLA